MSAVMRAGPPIGVQLIQPIVPHYRVPFFEGIARHTDLRVSLSASATIRGMPPSAPVNGMRVNTNHRCFEMFGGRVLWQSGLTLDRRLGPGDVLVINGNPRYLSSYPLAMSARRRGVAVVAWGHGWSATSSPLRARIRLQMMKLADVALVYTDAEKEDLLALGFESRRVFALNNALDDAKIARAASAWPSERLAQFRQSQQLDGAHVLLFCGRLRENPSTDLELALHALVLLAANGGRYLLTVIGAGPAGDALRARAESLGVADRVRWLGTIYEEEHLAPWFLSARCFVYPGSIGLSLIQSLAYGVPVITHDNRREHNPEIAALEHGVTGLTFRRGDASALATAVRQICENDVLRARMSSSARRKVEESYSMKGMVMRFAAAVTAAARLKADS